MLFLQPDISLEIERPVTEVKPALPPLNDVSGLIRLALADLEEIEKDERYIVDMDKAFLETRPVRDMRFGIIPRTQQKCFVCLAGCVMARTLEHPIHGESDRGAFCGEIGRIRALDLLRLGAVRYAFSALNIVWNKALPTQIHITPYAHNKEAFKSDMHQLADDLEAHGY